MTDALVDRAYGHGMHAALNMAARGSEEAAREIADARIAEGRRALTGRRMRLVILESPYAGDIEANVAYARACLRDSLSRGEAPIASHLLYTQPGVLRDDDVTERQWGIDAGLAWRAVAEASVVYTDRGVSQGMRYGIAAAQAAGLPVEYRFIEGDK